MPTPHNNYNLPPGVNTNDVDPPSLEQLDQECLDYLSYQDDERTRDVENPREY